MTQHNMLNVKLSHSELNKLKSTIKNGTEGPLNILSNLIGSSNDKINYPHELLLTDTKTLKAFANGSSANIKFWKTQWSKILKLWELAHSILNPFFNLIKTI